jgi:hypothetical protein
MNLPTVKIIPNSTVKPAPCAPAVKLAPISNPTPSRQKAVQASNATRLRCEIASVQQAGPVKIQPSPMHGAATPTDAFVQPPNLSPTPEAINRFMDEAGYDKQYIGAVYRQLDPSADPFDLGPREPVALKNAFQQKLDAGNLTNSTTASSAASGITPSGTFTADGQELFYLRTSNTNSNEVLLRTREEIELHLMIENHFLAIEQDAAGSEVCAIQVALMEEPPPAQTNPVTAIATDFFRNDGGALDEVPVHQNRLSASVPERADPQVDSGSPLRSAQGSGRCIAYTKENSGIDIDKFIAGLQSSGVARQHIGGENCNCWMRSTWLSSFIQCKDPQEMKKRLQQELSDRLIEKMPPRPQEKGAPTDHFPSIADQIEIIYSAVLDFNSGRLEETHAKGAGPFRKDIDDAITVLSQAFLMKNLKDDGLQGDAASARITSIDDATIGDGMGDTDQIRIIMRMLGFDMFMISPENSYIEIGLAPESALDTIFSPARAAITNCESASRIAAQSEANDFGQIECVELFAAAGRTTPQMLQEDLHFELYTQNDIWCTRA